MVSRTESFFLNISAECVYTHIKHAAHQTCVTMKLRPAVLQWESVTGSCFRPLAVMSQYTDTHVMSLWHEHSHDS
jgi:hypothetical protein